MLDAPMSPFTLSVDGPLATITYVRETKSCASEFMAVLDHAIGEGAAGVLFDKSDLDPSRTDDAVTVGKAIADKLLRHGVRLAAVLRNDDHQAKVALAVAAQEGACVLIGLNAREAYGWLRGEIS